jgi:Rrf2 family protein
MLSTLRLVVGIVVMFSQTVEYALRAMVFLAREGPVPWTTQHISEVTQVPRAYLSKVLQSLIRAGLVQSQRGLGGGITLARTPAQINLLEIVNAVDPIIRLKRCPLGLAAHGTRLCPLHRRLDAAMADVEKAFHGTTLDDLLREDPGSTGICEERATPLVSLGG